MTLGSGARSPSQAKSPPAAWALRQLDLPAEATTGEVHQRFTDVVEREGFLPSLITSNAFRYLCDRGVPTPTFEYARSRQLYQDDETEQVDEFAAEYFALPVEERKQRWQDLMQQAGLAENRQFLIHLESALEHDTAEFASAAPVTRKLLQQLCELYVLRPYPRSVKRRSFVRHAGSNTVCDPNQATIVVKSYSKWLKLDYLLATGIRVANRMTSTFTPRIEESTEWQNSRIYPPTAIPSTVQSNRITRPKKWTFSDYLNVSFWILTVLFVLMAVTPFSIMATLGLPTPVESKSGHSGRSPFYIPSIRDPAENTDESHQRHRSVDEHRTRTNPNIRRDMPK